MTTCGLLGAVLVSVTLCLRALLPLKSSTVLLNFTPAVDKANVAVTLLPESIDTEQAAVPLHAPDQPENTDPLEGVAVSVTCVPAVKLAEHVAPQSIAAGDEVTLPAPVPLGVTPRAE